MLDNAQTALSCALLKADGAKLITCRLVQPPQTACAACCWEGLSAPLVLWLCNCCWMQEHRMEVSTQPGSCPFGTWLH